MADSSLPHASPPTSDSSVPSRRTLPDDVIVLVAQHLSETDPQGASALRALQLCSSGGYRATTPVLYRHVTLRWPGALDSFFQPSYQEVLRGLDTHGVPIYKYGVWEPKPELMPPSTTRYLVDAFPVGDQATLDVHSGISRTIWACRHVERLVFEDIDILGGELDGRWVSKLVEDLIMQEDLLLYALTVITGVAQRSALCPNLGELVIGQGDIPAGEDW